MMIIVLSNTLFLYRRDTIMAVTIKKIAELAGVSTGTVDRALHDRGRVDPKVAQRIKQIALELDYRPNSVAKGLSN